MGQLRDDLRRTTEQYRELNQALAQQQQQMTSLQVSTQLTKMFYSESLVKESSFFLSKWTLIVSWYHLPYCFFRLRRLFYTQRFGGILSRIRGQSPEHYQRFYLLKKDTRGLWWYFKYGVE